MQEASFSLPNLLPGCVPQFPLLQSRWQDAGRSFGMSRRDVTSERNSIAGEGASSCFLENSPTAKQEPWEPPWGAWNHFAFAYLRRQP